jgi:hypothetical protein
MRAPQFCVSFGEHCHAIGGGRSSCFTRTVTPRGDSFMAGNATVFRDGQIESGAPIGVAGLVIGCATLRKAAIYAAGVVGWREPWGSIQETCPALTCGFPTCSRHLKKRRKLGCILSGKRSNFSLSFLRTPGLGAGSVFRLAWGHSARLSQTRLLCEYSRYLLKLLEKRVHSYVIESARTDNSRSVGQKYLAQLRKSAISAQDWIRAQTCGPFDLAIDVLDGVN